MFHRRGPWGSRPVTFLSERGGGWDGATTLNGQTESNWAIQRMRYMSGILEQAVSPKWEPAAG